MKKLDELTYRLESLEAELYELVIAGILSKAERRGAPIQLDLYVTTRRLIHNYNNLRRDLGMCASAMELTGKVYNNSSEGAPAPSPDIKGVRLHLPWKWGKTDSDNIEQAERIWIRNHLLKFQLLNDNPRQIPWSLKKVIKKWCKRARRKYMIILFSARMRTIFDKGFNDALNAKCLRILIDMLDDDEFKSLSVDIWKSCCLKNREELMDSLGKCGLLPEAAQNPTEAVTLRDCLSKTKLIEHLADVHEDKVVERERLLGEIRPLKEQIQAIQDEDNKAS